MPSDADETIASPRSAGDRPTAPDDAQVLAPDLAGRTMGQYEVLSKLGKGGMGEVYRARDTQLHREVAIKVLPEQLARDPEQLARLKREARVLAALNHPNIATLYGFESSGGTAFLVMELVPGETLADVVRSGPVPLERVLGIAGQVADALEAAHSQGITHRDIKPANVKVTPDGRVKVLDFGLAKTTGVADVAVTASLTIVRTYDGQVVGTPAYMSPEQARAKPLDHRTDIWAFGCLLFELLSGRRPFPGDTVSETLAKILEREPDWKALPASTPAAIAHLIRRCLEKDPDVRLAAISEARAVIAAAQKQGWRPGRREAVAAVAVGLLLIAAFAGYWLLARRAGPAPPGAVPSDAATQQRQDTAATLARPPAAAIADPAAQRLYLQGRYYWNQRTDDGLRKSADAFQQAIDRDPNYALAWAGLADAYLMLGAWSIVQPKDAYSRAKAAAERAIALDDSLAEPHATLGYFKTLFEWDWPGADREFRRSIDLQPRYSTAHHWYAYYFVTVGDNAHAIAEIERAREIDPLSRVINDEVGYFHLTVRDYPTALEELRKTIDLDPASEKARMRLAEVYALLGRTRDALTEVRAVSLEPSSNANEVASAANIYAACGERTKALALIDELEAQAQKRYIMPAILAAPHAMVGNTQRALDLLDRAVEERSLVVSWLRLPRFDNLRGDPRFKALFDRLGLRM